VKDMVRGSVETLGEREVMNWMEERRYGLSWPRDLTMTSELLEIAVGSRGRSREGKCEAWGLEGKREGALLTGRPRLESCMMCANFYTTADDWTRRAIGDLDVDGPRPSSWERKGASS
jgi:hypothetical protein